MPAGEGSRTGQLGADPGSHRSIGLGGRPRFGGDPFTAAGQAAEQAQIRPAASGVNPVAFGAAGVLGQWAHVVQGRTPVPSPSWLSVDGTCASGALQRRVEAVSLPSLDLGPAGVAL